MNEEMKEYGRLVSALLDGTLAPGERAALNRALRESEACRRIYREEMETHALLSFRSAQGHCGQAGRARRGWRWMRWAAAAVLLLAGLASASYASYRWTKADGSLRETRPASRTLTGRPARRTAGQAPARGTQSGTWSSQEDGRTAGAFASATSASGAESAPNAGQGGKDMNTVTQFIAAAALAGWSSVAPGMSNSIRIDANPDASIHWHTLLSEAAEINWAWPDNAQSAVLHITGTGVGIVQTFDRPVSNWVWHVTAPKKESAENVFALKLVFFTDQQGAGDELSGETLSAQGIGSVRGTMGNTLRAFGDGTDDNRWTHVYGNRAVVPVLAGSTNLTVNSVQQEMPPAPGWFMLSPVKVMQNYVLILEGNETSSALLIGFPNSFYISIK
jgi:hypothetical protein